MPQPLRFVSACFIVGTCLLSRALLAASADGQQVDDLFDLSLEQLLAYEVTIASKHRQPIEQAPAIVSVITREEIAQRSWRNLSEILDQIPGFMLRRQEAGAISLVVRGMRAVTGALILLDGVPVNDPLDGNFAFFDMPIQTLEKIEIIRGPGSALYGGNATLAVINLITQDRSHRPYQRLQLAAGEYDYKNTSYLVNYHAASFKLKGWLEADEYNAESLAIPSDAIDDLVARNEALDSFGAIAQPNNRRASQSEFLSLGAQLVSTQGWSKGLSVQGVYLSKRHQARLSRLLAMPGEHGLEIRHDLNKLAINYQRDLGAISISARAFYTYLYRRSAGQLTRPYERNDDEDFDGISERWPNGKQEVRSYEIDNYGLEVSSNWQVLDDLTLTSGLISQEQQLGATRNLANFTSAINGSPLSINLGQVVDLHVFDPKNNKQTYWIEQDVSRTLTAAYVQAQWQLTDKLAMISAVRHDHFDDFGHFTSPRLGLTWQWSKRTHMKFLYSQAFSPPSFISLYDKTVTAQNASRQFGNPSLNRAQIQTGEVLLGIKLDRHWTWLTSLFMAKTQDEVIFDTDSELYKNDGERSTFGIEVELTGHWPNHRIWSHLSIQEPKDGAGTGAPIYPKQQFNLGFYSRHWEPVSLSMDYTYRAKMPRESMDTRESIGEHHSLRLSGHYHFSQALSLSLSVANLFDEPAFSPVDMTQAAALPNDIELDGRRAVLALTYHF